MACNCTVVFEPVFRYIDFLKSRQLCKNDNKYYMEKCAVLLFILKCNQIANFYWVCVIRFGTLDQATCFLNLF